MVLLGKFFRGGSVTTKLIVIGILILVFIPVSLLVVSLIDERADRQTETIREVGEKWGQVQIIRGPVLVVPYLSTNKSTEYAYFLPENLEIEANVVTEVRSRGIYDVPLYQGNFDFKGKFNHPNFYLLGVNNFSIYWDQAFIAVGIPDMRGIAEQININVNGVEYLLGSGIKSNIFESGMSTPIKIEPKNPTELAFSLTLNLRGSESLFFTPVGKSTSVNLVSDWLYPSFNGGFLPVSSSIAKDGFTATWGVLNLNTNYSHQGTSEQNFRIGDKFDDMGDSNIFGVDFYFPGDVYQKTTRSAKYSLAVISLVFLVFFLVEVIANRRIHPLQYILVGLALCIFYTLLLALAEYIRFGYAYLIASFSIITMVTLFSRSVMKKNILALTCGLMLILLYMFIYVLLQMQDFALLIGSIGIFVILGVVMFVTRKIDWYKVES